MSDEIDGAAGKRCTCGFGMFASGPTCGTCGGLTSMGVSVRASALTTMRVLVSKEPADDLWYAEGVDIWLTSSGETKEAAQTEFIRAVKRSADLTMQEFGSVAGLLGDQSFTSRMADRVALDSYAMESEPFSHEYLPFTAVMWLSPV